MKRGDQYLVEELIRLGADVDALSAGSWYSKSPGIAIAETFKHGNHGIISALLLAGADVKVHADEKSSTLLQEALRRDDEWAVRKLIELGVDVNAPAARSSLSWKPNHVPDVAILEAVKNGNQGIVDLLIGAGAFR